MRSCWLFVHELGTYFGTGLFLLREQSGWFKMFVVLLVALCEQASALEEMNPYVVSTSPQLQLHSRVLSSAVLTVKVIFRFIADIIWSVVIRFPSQRLIALFVHWEMSRDWAFSLKKALASGLLSRIIVFCAKLLLWAEHTSVGFNYLLVTTVVIWSGYFNLAQTYCSQLQSAFQ